MSTDAQIAANKINAQHSTGPRSEDGKAASSQNHLRFGFTARFAVMHWEKQADFDALSKKLNDQHQPGTEFEADLVQKMAQHYWLAQRALLLQEMCFDLDYPRCHERQEKQLALYLRYQTTHERAFERYSNELRKLRNETRKVEIGFESQKRHEADATRKQAAENRKTELHQWAVWLAEAKFTHQQVLTDGARLPQLVAAIAEEDRLKAEAAA